MADRLTWPDQVRPKEGLAMTVLSRLADGQKDGPAFAYLMACVGFGAHGRT